MSYEPRGKVKDLFDAMRASSQEVWECDDVAKVMCIPKGNVTVYVNSAMRNGLLHRKIENGRSHFSLRPFAEPAALPPASDQPPPIPKTDNWQPPRMVAPRGDTQAPRAPLPQPLHQVLAPAPTPEPTPPPTDEPESAGVDEDEAEEEVAFNAQLWLDGDLFLYGLEQMEDGSYKVPAEHVPALRGLLGGGVR